MCGKSSRAKRAKNRQLFAASRCGAAQAISAAAEKLGRGHGGASDEKLVDDWLEREKILAERGGIKLRANTPMPTMSPYSCPGNEQYDEDPSGGGGRDCDARGDDADDDDHDPEEAP